MCVVPCQYVVESCFQVIEKNNILRELLVYGTVFAVATELPEIRLETTETRQGDRYKVETWEGRLYNHVGARAKEGGTTQICVGRYNKHDTILGHPLQIIRLDFCDDKRLIAMLRYRRFRNRNLKDPSGPRMKISSH